MKAVHPALVAMKVKLKKYYKLTEGPYIYASALILNPRWKLSMFQQESWETGLDEQYREVCREKFMQEYNDLELPEEPTHTVGRKHSYSMMETEEEDIFEELRGSFGGTQGPLNQYDEYTNSP